MRGLCDKVTVKNSTTSQFMLYNISIANFSYLCSTSSTPFSLLYN